jgi:CxxC motif-containing protein (DUF1111 family)
MRILVAALGASAIAAATAAFASGEMDSVLGRALFERDWVPSPSSTDASNGLGPLFTARSCKGCHAGDALAARFADAPDGRVAGRGLVIRFGDNEGRPDPLYGHLLQNQSMQGLRAEGHIVLNAPDEPEGALNVALTLDRGALDPATRQSVRIAPPLRGRALLDQVDPDAVVPLADPDDADGDGISGRARMIDVGGIEKLGRYGWKASTTGLEEQIADAFAADLGLSSAKRPFPHGDCTELEADCMAAPTGVSARFENQEISAEMIELVAAFVGSLHPTDAASKVDLGRNLFASTGCAACHQPEMPSVDGGTIASYTDLLLHDMGAALDDGVGERGVASSEWRTAPLIGMAPTPGRRYMHDGRAPTLDSAIRAHDGEAAKARENYLALTDVDRQTLIEFVGAL